MPQSKTPERDNKRRVDKRRDCKRRASKTGAKETGAASSPTAEPSGDAPMEPTVESLIQGLDKARKSAIEHDRPAAIVNTTIAIARLLRLLPDTPGRPSSKAGPAAPFKFDGNYHNAARRIALLLELGKKEPEDGGQESGKDDRTDT
jgi:hypothetical protein